MRDRVVDRHITLMPGSASRLPDGAKSTACRKERHSRCFSNKCACKCHLGGLK